jgi:hypothetical protein
MEFFVTPDIRKLISEEMFETVSEIEREAWIAPKRM